MMWCTLWKMNWLLVFTLKTCIFVKTMSVFHAVWTYWHIDLLQSVNPGHILSNLTYHHLTSINSNKPTFKHITHITYSLQILAGSTVEVKVFPPESVTPGNKLGTFYKRSFTRVAYIKLYHIITEQHIVRNLILKWIFR